MSAILLIFCWYIFATVHGNGTGFSYQLAELISTKSLDISWNIIGGFNFRWKCQSNHRTMIQELFASVKGLMISTTEFILGLHPANERHCYEVPLSLIRWAQTENEPCINLPAWSFCHRSWTVSCCTMMPVAVVTYRLCTWYCRAKRDG